MSMSSVPCNSSIRFLYWSFSLIGVDTLPPMGVDRLLRFVLRTEQLCPPSRFTSTSVLRTKIGDSALALNRQITCEQRSVPGCRHGDWNSVPCHQTGIRAGSRSLGVFEDRSSERFSTLSRCAPCPVCIIGERVHCGRVGQCYPCFLMDSSPSFTRLGRFISPSRHPWAIGVRFWSCVLDFGQTIARKKGFGGRLSSVSQSRKP